MGVGNAKRRGKERGGGGGERLAVNERDLMHTVLGVVDLFALPCLSIYLDTKLLRHYSVGKSPILMVSPLIPSPYSFVPVSLTDLCSL